ncbi:MAG: DUF3990 domain-containing protein, partial [Spirochaetaceae bacterium]|jgi:hypothetical protein|nr:DUF3990 domain-containing protein [Spirochaetaceae bacterium]
MTIYHGSSIIVKTPELRYSVRALDFGEGFYTTTNEEQAVQFARKIHERKIRGGAENPGCFVNSYGIDYDAMQKQLAILTFDIPDEAWLDFVMANRGEKYTGKKYDVIYGPVANDTVYRALVGYETGLYTKKQTIKQLAVRRLFSQMTFATEKSLSFLSFAGYREIDPWKN